MKIWVRGKKEEFFINTRLEQYRAFPVYCPYCSAEVHDEFFEIWKYCPYCGKEVGVDLSWK